MMFEPREPAVAESYPTFWDDFPRTRSSPVQLIDDAYSVFVNLTEEDLPPAELLPEVE